MGLVQTNQLWSRASGETEGWWADEGRGEEGESNSRNFFDTLNGLLHLLALPSAGFFSALAGSLFSG